MDGYRDAQQDSGFLVLILLVQDLNRALGFPANNGALLCNFFTLFKTYNKRADAMEMRNTWLIKSVQFSCSVVSDSLWPHGLQHTRSLCPSPTPGVYSNSCPLSWWHHPTISSSVIPFSFHLQSFPVSGSFQMKSELKGKSSLLAHISVHGTALSRSESPELTLVVKSEFSL